MSQSRNDQKAEPTANQPADRRSRRQSSTASRRAQRRVEEERSRRRQRFMLVGGAVILAVVIVGALILVNRPDNGDDASDLAVTVPAARDASIPQDGRTFGNPDAPVTRIFFFAM